MIDSSGADAVDLPFRVAQPFKPPYSADVRQKVSVQLSLQATDLSIYLFCPYEYGALSSR
jgi:hypothetical protein